MKCIASIMLLILAGCSRDSVVYPSLAERPAEKRSFAEPVPAVPEPPRSDPALDARIAALTQQLATIAREFDGDLVRAEALARSARGQTVGSEAWLEAQTALAKLDDWRAQASSLTVDADQLISERAATLAPATPALLTLRDSAAAEARRQDEAIGRVQSGLAAA